MRLMLSLCGTLLIASPLAAQPSASLQKAYEGRNAAVRAGHGKEWGKYATDDYTMTGPDGGLETKQQRMTEIEGHPLAVVPTDVKWREYGNAAIETEQVMPRGKPARLIVVWVKQGKSWKVAAAQFTPVSRPSQ